MAAKANTIDLGELQNNLVNVTKKLGKAHADAFKAQCVLTRAEDTLKAVREAHADAKRAIADAARELTK